MSIALIEEIKLGRRKLVFGDEEIIRAVRSYEKDLEEAPKRKVYEVTLSFAGSVTLQVAAHDEQEAEELAREDMDLAAADIDDVSLERIEEKEKVTS